MNLLFWGITLGVFGKVLVVVAVLHMHHSLVKEHRIDRTVLFTYKQERIMTFIGLILIVLGYLFEVYFYGPTALFNCEGQECSALLMGAQVSQ
ncbi:MAG: hypothetical protein KBC78_04095 [Candidatus Pacebacteria bacterium]|nr:hypothetical protein [Candidatus Paceibacterota bacterium]